MSSPVSAPCERLSWDSDFFGFGIAQTTAPLTSPQTLEAVDAWCTQNQIRCLYLLTEPDSAESALIQTHGFKLVDIRMTLEHRAPSTAPAPTSAPASFAPHAPPPDARIRPFRPGDLPALQAIAAAVHTDTRFFTDSNFSVERSREMYRIWISKSAQDPAKQVWVAAAEQDIPVGYVTCEQNGAIGQIGLLGVAEECRKQGIGRALVSRALRWFESRNVRQTRVVLQGQNQAALHTYRACGFGTLSVLHRYHKWYRLD